MRPLILDGGLATGLEEAGHELHPRLWSAGVFLQHPEAVERLHLAYLEAGAEIIVSASYQMSFEGLAGVGLSRAAAAKEMRRTVEVARRAVARHGGGARVAASIGPYGATLADGSEYHGRYGVGAAELSEFHRERFRVLCGAGADLLAVETIPSLDEARALAEVLRGEPAARAWVSFACRDAARLNDGEPIERAARALDGLEQVVALGVNCTAPEHVAGLMDALRRATSRPLVVYPNSGEVWDARSRRWGGRPSIDRFCELARVWAARGAWAIGGCCRVGPDTIRRLAAALRV